MQEEKCVLCGEGIFTSAVDQKLTRQDDAWVPMMSGVTKRSRLPRTATASHGLRKTREGLLVGALRSIPAEASSAVV